MDRFAPLALLAWAVAVVSTITWLVYRVVSSAATQFLASLPF